MVAGTRRYCLVLALGAFGFSKAFTASAGVVCNMSIIIDPENFIENEVQAIQATKKLLKQVDHYITQVKQYKAQYDQWHARTNLTVPIPTDTHFVELSFLTDLRANLRKLESKLQGLKKEFDQRVTQAGKMGLDFNQYIAWEQARINQNVDAAVKTAQRERDILKAVRMDFEYVDDLLKQTEKTKGMHEDAQVFNRQVVRVLYQHADLAQVLAPVATANGILTNSFVSKMEQRQIQLERQRLTKAAQDAVTRQEGESLRVLRENGR